MSASCGAPDCGPAARWREALRANELADGQGREVEIEGRGLALFRSGDQYYAVAASCTHEEFSLADGRVENGTVECPLHGAKFELRTGKALRLPAVAGLQTFPVRIEAGKVLVFL